MRRQLPSWSRPTTKNRESKPPNRGRFQPRLEILEPRLTPTVGVFNEDFSDDPNPAAPSFDSPADGLLIVNDLPRYGTALEGPTGRAGYYYLQTGHLGDPGWGLHADGHVLAILSSAFSTPQVTFTVPTPGTPGAHDADEEVSGIGVSVQGFGTVEILGANGIMSVR